MVIPSMKMSARLLLPALLLAFAASVITSCASHGTPKSSVRAEKDRKDAPDFKLKDSNGQTVQLADFKGKVVLLNFWATWCGPCTTEIPWFMEFEQSFKDRGFAILGVAMDDDGWESVKPYVSGRKMNYRVLMGSETMSALYGGVEALPTTFIIDRDGKIASMHVGLIDKNEYKNEILHLLDNQKRTAAGNGIASAADASAN